MKFEITASDPFKILSSTKFAMENAKRVRLSQKAVEQIGHAIWLMSQDQALQSRIKPYHRTYTTFY